MSQTASAVSRDRADELRAAMADKLVADGWIASPDVERAFRAVPRHLFTLPGSPLDDAYHHNKAPYVKVGDDGRPTSTVSAAWLQARMIAQAHVRPGMRVLEVGSGGYNAALLSEVTGPDGQVVTMDVDPDITSHAEAALDAAGYAGRVEVVTGDGEDGVPSRAPFDAVIVTVGAWDLPPAWTAQLAPGGTLVVPLRIGTISRSIGFRKDRGRLVSESWEKCGFVPMTGAGGHQGASVDLHGPDGGRVSLTFDQDPPSDPRLLEGALSTPQAEAWSGKMIPPNISFDGLVQWLPAFAPGFCRVNASEGTELHDQGREWKPFGLVDGDSFACLALRRVDAPAGDGHAYEFGAKAYGLRAAAAAAALVAQVHAWDYRELAQDAFTFWPAGTSTGPLPPLTSSFPKAHGTVTVTWPAAP